MPFTKLRAGRYELFLLLALALLAVGGCSHFERQDGLGAAEAQDEPRNNREKTADDGFQYLPNPYRNSQKPLASEAKESFARARQAMHDEQWQEAEKILRQMTQEYPDLSGPYVNLGLIHWQRGEVQRAKEAFVTAIEINPLNSNAYNQLAVLHREQGEFEQAEQRYQQALDVWPHNPVVHRNLGILYDLYMGRLDEALHHYQMSQKIIAANNPVSGNEEGGESSDGNRELEGWIVDLQRRMSDQQAAMN